jgi:hypothetical protein
MLVGESRPFRAVDGHGRFLHEVQWTVSQPGIVEVSSGDEVVVTAVKVGSVSLTVHAPSGFADAHVEVIGGDTLPQGTIMWSSGDLPGCHTTKIMPAVPSASGADIFEQSQCADGTYIRAYTADGVLLWRRKIGSAPGTSTPEQLAPPSAKLDTRAASICDSVSMGMKKEAVAALAKSRHLASPDSETKTWLLEEDGVQCRLWFNDSGVVKKRKTLTTD